MSRSKVIRMFAMVVGAVGAITVHLAVLAGLLYAGVKIVRMARG